MHYVFSLICRLIEKIFNSFLKSLFKKNMLTAKPPQSCTLLQVIKFCSQTLIVFNWYLIKSSSLSQFYYRSNSARLYLRHYTELDHEFDAR